MQDVAKGRPRSRVRLIEGLKLYLADARVDASISLSIRGVAEQVGVKKSTIYRYEADDAEVASLLGEIRHLDQARKAARLVGADIEEQQQSRRVPRGTHQDSNPQPELHEHEIALVASQAIKGAVWAMSRFVGRHRHHRYVSDLPRVVFDLDKAIGELHGALTELRHLSDDWSRCQSSLNGSEEVQARLHFDE